jgi:hypothetical protein
MTTLLKLEHRPIEGYDFMPSGWCGACEHCGPAPTICLACSFDVDGMPVEAVRWPCAHAEPLCLTQAVEGVCCRPLRHDGDCERLGRMP